MLAGCVVVPGTVLAASQHSWLTLGHQGAIVLADLVVGVICLIGSLRIPVLDSPDAVFPFPLPLFDWSAITYAASATATQRTAWCTLGYTLLGFLSFAFGLVVLVIEPPTTEEFTAAWLVLLCEAVWFVQFALPMIGALISVESIFNASLALGLVHVALGIAAISIGVTIDVCDLVESAVWATVGTSLVGALGFIFLWAITLGAERDDFCNKCITGVVGWPSIRIYLELNRYFGDSPLRMDDHCIHARSGRYDLQRSRVVRGL